MNMSSNKCLTGIALSAMCLAVSSAHAATLLDLLKPVPAFTAYDIDGAPNGYIIKGSIQVPNPAAPGGVAVIPGATIVVDPPHHRVVYAFGPIGTFITTAAGSTNIDFQGTPSCYTNGFTYANYEQNYKQITSIPNQIAANTIFTGLTHDSFSCDQWINFNFTQTMLPAGLNNFIPVVTDLRADLPSPFQIPGTNPPVNVCVPVQADFVADISTLDTNPADFNQYFGNPADQTSANVNAIEPLCATPQDYCKKVYQQGNVCGAQENQLY